MNDEKTPEAVAREERERQFEKEFEEAANDPLFMADLEECMHDFRFVDAETARMIPFDEDFDVAP